MKTLHKCICLLSIIFFSSTESETLKNIETAIGTLDFNAGIRLRYEYFSNMSLKSYGTGSNDHVLYDRINVGAKYKLPLNTRVVFDIYGAHMWLNDYTAHDFNTACSHQNTLDIWQMYVEMTNIGNTPFAFRLGRQPIAFDDARVWGPGSWGNSGRYRWDGLTIGYKTKPLTVDMMYARQVIPLPFELDNTHYDYHAGGIYATIGNIPFDLDIFYTVRINTQDTTIGENDTGNIWLNTIGLHVKDTLGAFDIEGTYANQSGIFGGVSTAAHALAFVGGYTFANNYQPRVALAYTFASGDKDPNDGKRGTFDGLYGSPAVYYGRMNLFYWMNIHDIQSDLSLRPLKKGLLLFSYHYFMLAESRDAWYSTGAKVWRSGALAMRQKDGSSGNELGHEIDIVATYPINKSIKFQLGYGHLFPGKFIRTMALNPSENNWFYTQLEWNI